MTTPPSAARLARSARSAPPSSSPTDAGCSSRSAWRGRRSAVSTAAGRTALVEVEELPEVDGAVEPTLLPRVQAALDGYLTTVKRFVATAASIGHDSTEVQEVARSLDEVLKPIALPDDALAASYAVGGVLQIELSRKQHLLELPDAGSRLRAELAPARARVAPPRRRGDAAGQHDRPVVPPELIAAMRSATRRRSAPLVAPHPRCRLRVAVRHARRRSPRPAPARAGHSSPSASATGTAAPTATATVVPSAAVTTYVVQGGDTLFGIARRFGTTPANLQTWNAARYPSLVNDPGTLVAGWELIVAQQPGVTPQPTVPPTPPVTPRPTVPPPVGDLPCRAGDRAGGGMATYARIPNAGNEVALTFDMGGRLDPALDIMAFLVANKVCATIFATGAMSSTPIGQQVLGIIRAHPGQFEIGNHTHGALRPRARRRRLAHHGAMRHRRTASCLVHPQPADRCGGGPARRHRPGPPAVLATALRVDQPRSLAAAASVGYTKTFLWDVDSIDWKPESQGGPTAQQIAVEGHHERPGRIDRPLPPRRLQHARGGEGHRSGAATARPRHLEPVRPPRRELGPPIAGVAS